LVQRVPVGDHRTQVSSQAARPCAEPHRLCLGCLPASQTCRERPLRGANRTGLTLRMPSACGVVDVDARLHSNLASERGWNRMYFSRLDPSVASDCEGEVWARAWHVQLEGLHRDMLGGGKRSRRGQRKHGFAAHRRGARSRQCCEESPRALVQRVPVGDHRTQVSSQAARPRAEPRRFCLGRLPAAQTCRERPQRGANRTGLTLRMPSTCGCSG